MHLCTPSINTCKIHNTHVHALAARLRAHYIMCTIICCAYVYNLRDVMVSWRVNVPCVHRSLPPSIPQAPPRLPRLQHTNGQGAEITSGSFSFPLGLYLAIILLLLLQILPLASSTPSVCSFSLSRYRPPPLLLSHNRAIPCHTSSTILLFRDFLLYQIPRLLLLLLHRPKPSPPYSTLLFDKTPLCSVAPLRFITTLLYSSFFFRPSPP